MKKIEVGTSTFAKLIEADNIYVDKTDIIYNIITSGSTFFFCSRPRRFGKTLTLSTLEEIFKGNKELFKGLKIYDTDYDWKEYPVVRLDLSKINASTPKALETQLNEKLFAIAEQYGVSFKHSRYCNANLDSLIIALSQKGKVVVLIDEYDNILSNNINNPRVEALREVLKGFFSVIKADSDYMQFVFITGVTKFSKVSIFSSMNNLIDLSFIREYATLFGYTEEEVKHYFSEYIEEGIKRTGLSYAEYMAKLEKKYNGNRFSPDSEITVYNPVSIGLFFFYGGEKFNNYWVDTGGTKLLMDIAKEVRFDISKDLDTPVRRASIANFDILEMASKRISKIKYMTLLQQSGYLTIKEILDKNGNLLRLDFPNDEVEEAYSVILLDVYTDGSGSEYFEPSELYTAFDDGDAEKAIRILKAIYSSVPYDLEKHREADFSAMFHCMLKAIGARIQSEAETSRGRADAIVETSNDIYIIEFKLDKNADEALSQIHETKYYEPYLAGKKKVHLIGINFSSSEKNINEWKEEIL